MDKIPKSRKIQKLSTFIVQKTIIVPKAEQAKGTWTSMQKHPIMSQWEHLIVEFLFLHEHKNNNHEGTKDVSNKVQQQFWLLSSEIPYAQ